MEVNSIYYNFLLMYHIRSALKNLRAIIVVKQIYLHDLTDK